MSARILVVDDEPDLEHLVRQKFRRKIRNDEYAFFFALNGVEALNILNNEPDIDLILTDINMPEMDGLTLLNELNTMDILSKPVVVSAYGDMDNIRTAMNRGAFDFVTKPIDLQDLETTIEKGLRELQAYKKAMVSHNQLVALQQELNIAAQIQTSILPQTFPPFPDRKEFAVHASMNAAKEVGGDFYDFFLIDKDRLGIVIGDVSGKGVPAAMLMAVTRTLLKATALKGIPPDACLTTVNEVLFAESLPNMFVTLFYGVLNTRNGAFEFCNGGHNTPYIIGADGTIKPLEYVGGTFVGMMNNMDYETKMMILQPGDVLFLYTDGVTEARNVENKEYDEPNLEKCLQLSASKPINELIEHVVEDVRNFSEGMPQTDDITCLAVKYIES